MDIDIEKLKKEYSDFYTEEIPYAKEYILEIFDYSVEHTNLMINHYGPGVQQIEAGFALLSNILEKLNYIDKDDWPNHRAYQYIFLIHNMKSLFASFHLLNRGFGESSIIVLRSVYEAMMNVINISLYKEDPDRVFRGDLKITNFIRDELKLNHWNDYPILSIFSHANYKLTCLYSQNPNKITFNPRPRGIMANKMKIVPNVSKICKEKFTNFTKNARKLRK